MLLVMPDSHQGYGMPIGSILAAKNVMWCQMLLELDIGCGMCALRTELKEISQKIN